MHAHVDILMPVFALAAWTGIVLLLVPIARFRAAARREVTARDFALGESARVPAAVSLPNRNLMNLLELPVLFYVVCLVVVAADVRAPHLAGIAWAYVALRVLHSLIHLTYNRVFHRLIVFALSNLVLIALWVLAGIGVFSG